MLAECAVEKPWVAAPPNQLLHGLQDVSFLVMNLAGRKIECLAQQKFELGDYISRCADSNCNDVELIRRLSIQIEHQQTVLLMITKKYMHIALADWRSIEVQVIQRRNRALIEPKQSNYFSPLAQ